MCSNVNCINLRQRNTCILRFGQDEKHGISVLSNTSNRNLCFIPNDFLARNTFCCVIQKKTTFNVTICTFSPCSALVGDSRSRDRFWLRIGWSQSREYGWKSDYYTDGVWKNVLACLIGLNLSAGGLQVFRGLPCNEFRKQQLVLAYSVYLKEYELKSCLPRTGMDTETTLSSLVKYRQPQNETKWCCELSIFYNN